MEQAKEKLSKALERAGQEARKAIEEKVGGWVGRAFTLLLPSLHSRSCPLRSPRCGGQPEQACSG